MHLHNHTHYSLLDGLTKVPNLVKKVKEAGMEAVAITDHGTLSGAIELYKEAKDAGIKPIIGMETYVAARKHTDKEAGKDKPNFHLILLAMNNAGYQNLMKLSSIAQLDGMYYKPRIDHDLLEKYSEGLICLSACIGGEIGSALRDGDYETAKEKAAWHKKIFGDRYYLEIQDHHESWDEQKKVNIDLLKLGKELEIRCVVTSDAHYLDHEDQDAHEILLCIQTGNFLSDEKRMSLKEFDLYVSDPQSVADRWPDNLDLLTNTKEIADRCEIEIDLGGILIPKFDVGEGMTEKTQLQKDTYIGLIERYVNEDSSSYLEKDVKELKKLLTDEQVERAEYELGVINKMGFDGYFLIVADFINWGKQQGIVFGPGRGSAAGSLVSYALRITDLDPLKYDLLFERFLNPDRISMPDIDIDIQDSRRDEVIEYVVEKYGQENVAHIVTFGTMAARNAIRDVSRVLQYPYGEADRIAKLVPPPIQGRHIPLVTSLEDDQDLKREYENNDAARPVFDQAVRLEGTIRSHGVHAAGVVIAPDDITNYTPLEMSQKGVVTTQYSMNPVEELGLLKMDFLGLSNLTTINNASRIIRKVYKDEIDLEKLPLDDEKTFKLLAKGETTGVFQLESSGMKRYIRSLKPDKFEDIMAMVALYRPGPMQFIDDFIERKHGKKKIVFQHPNMKSALESTYGILVYQEQVMQLARELAGFTGGQSDTLRKAIGKKKRDVMAKMKSEFIDGSMNTSGVSEEVAESIWADWEAFADYAFNKSHAACYGLISYWTAYLKANYTDAFMAALMTTNYDDTDKLAIDIDECRKLGIEVLQPDVNESFPEFAVVPGKSLIRFGLNAVKNVGSGAAEAIVEARSSGGEFASLEDFLGRVDYTAVNKKTLESLIKSGSLDRFDDRKKLVSNLDLLVKYAANIQKEQASNQANLFGDDSSALGAHVGLMLEPTDESKIEGNPLQWEKDLTGVYISDHPLNDFKKYLKEKALPIADVQKIGDDSEITIGGQIKTVKEIVTKKGQKMAFVQLEDLTEVIEVIFFPSTYAEFGEFVTDNAILLVRGKVSSRGRDGIIEAKKIIAEEPRPISVEAAKNFKSTGKKYEAKGATKNGPKNVNKNLYINVVDSSDVSLLSSIKNTIQKVQGNDAVIMVVGEGDNKSALRLPFKTDKSDEELLNTLKDLLGEERVLVK